MDLLGDAGDANGQGYRVLARAYRPTKLSELIGQDILVRALTNAFASGRIAHAFLLCGIRGVGKTTTARIIARALNCTGADDQGAPTPEPCGICSSCRSIASDSTLDVVEMDAATHTGINDIREIVESIGYAPAASRYKIYIIDEVHMLSINAFNGLLKTLEEPPPHVKFIFATTEARKVPITVVSRCQRFDLRRVDIPVLQDHLSSICQKESVEAASDALAMISRAAEGSVRDSLSLLDQAIALSEGNVSAKLVSSMLGYGRKDDMLALLGMLLEGQTAQAVSRVRDLYKGGAEPVAIVHDLLELSHELTALKIGTEGAGGIAIGDLAEQARALASAHDLERFSRFWQMLLKGLDEVRMAPQPLAAMEMLTLRLACASQLPPPGDLAKMLKGVLEQGHAPFSNTGVQGHSSSSSTQLPSTQLPSTPRSSLRTASSQSLAIKAPQAQIADSPQSTALPENFVAMIAKLREAGQPMIAATLEQGTHLISYQAPNLTLRLEPTLPTDFTGKLGHALAQATGQRWVIALEREGGEDTLFETRRVEKERLIKELASAPEIKHVLDAIPGASIIDVRSRSNS